MASSAIFASDRSAVIFGAANGIGRAAAAHCLSAGMRVVAVDRDADMLGHLAGPSIETIVADVGDFAAVQRVRDDIASRHRDIALVMNNAGHGAGAGAYMRGAASPR